MADSTWDDRLVAPIKDAEDREAVARVGRATAERVGQRPVLDPDDRTTLVWDLEPPSGPVRLRFCGSSTVVELQLPRDFPTDLRFALHGVDGEVDEDLLGAREPKAQSNSLSDRVLPAIRPHLQLTSCWTYEQAVTETLQRFPEALLDELDEAFPRGRGELSFWRGYKEDKGAVLTLEWSVNAEIIDAALPVKLLGLGLRVRAAFMASWVEAA